MGLHETIETARSADVAPLDWVAFHAQLAPAVEGPPFLARRRTIDLGSELIASVTLEERDCAMEQHFDAVRTGIRFGTVWAHLTAPWQLVQALVDARGIDQDCDLLPATVISMVAEHLLSPVLTSLEQSMGGSCQMGPIPASLTADAHLCMAVVLDGQSHCISIDTTSDTAERVLKLFPPASPLTPIRVSDHMLMPIAIHSPPVAIPAGTLSDFGPGDVLLPETRWPVMTQAVLVSDGHFLGDIALDRDAGTASLSALADQDFIKRNDDMTTSNTLARPDAGTPLTRRGKTSSHTALENLNVIVSVEMSRSEMPLGDLRKLTVGTVLPFEGELGDPVTLLANGAPFASGELVRIGERIGVRLTELT